MSDIKISIHAPSRERRKGYTLLLPRHNFNPRSLAGATSWNRKVQDSVSNFNPRSLAGATLMLRQIASIINISIHAPSRERLYTTLRQVTQKANFNPRSLAGATFFLPPALQLRGISIHAPSRERQTACNLVANVNAISIHAPSRERL